MNRQVQIRLWVSEGRRGLYYPRVSRPLARLRQRFRSQRASLPVASRIATNAGRIAELTVGIADRVCVSSTARRCHAVGISLTDSEDRPVERVSFC